MVQTKNQTEAKMFADLKSKNYRVRAKAAKKFGKTEDTKYCHIIREMLDSESNTEVKTALILALAKLSDQKLDPTSKDLEKIKNFLDSRNILLKTASLKALTIMGPKNLYEIINPFLIDEDNTIISLTVKILWRFFPGKLLEQIRVLLESKDKKHRKCAVWALSELQFSVAAPLLKKAQNDHNISVRLTAGDILKELEKNYLEKIEIQAQKKEISDNGIDSLPEKSESKELECDKPDPHESIPHDSAPHDSASQDSASQDSPPQELVSHKPIPEKLTELKVDPTNLVYFKEMDELLNHNDPDILVKIIKIHENAGSKNILPKLFELIERNRNEKVLATAIKAIGLLGKNDSIDVISPFLNDKNPRVAANALEGLSYSNSIRAKELALPFIDNKNSRIAQNALVLISQFDENMVYSHIEDMLSDKPNIQKTAVRTLEKIGTQRALDVLTHLYLESENELHKITGRAINSIKNAHSIIGRLKSKDTFTSKHSKQTHGIKELKFKLKEACDEVSILTDENNQLNDKIRALKKDISRLQNNKNSLINNSVTPLAPATLTAPVTPEKTTPPEPSIAPDPSITPEPSVASEPSVTPETIRYTRTKKKNNKNLKKIIFPVLCLIFIFLSVKLVYKIGQSLFSKKTEIISSKIVVSPKQTLPKKIIKKIEKKKILHKSSEIKNNQLKARRDIKLESSTASTVNYTPVLSQEIKEGLSKIKKILDDCKKLNGSNGIILMEKGIENLRNNFYMGELYLFEAQIKEKNYENALKELEKVYKMISQGFILWDFQTGEWISPREDF